MTLKRVKRIFLFFYTIAVINGVKTPIPKKSRYKIIKGGRGSAKSWEVVIELVYRASDHYERILCCREIQRSMKQSVHNLIVKMIYKMGLEDQWHITDKVIRHKYNGSEFFFEGLWNNQDSIKSIEGITICWVEEAQAMSKRSWEVLKPTIRGEGSEIWLTYNPTRDEDPVHALAMNPPDNCMVLEQNHNHNPFLPDVLKEEEQYMKETDFDLWRHIWNGETMQHSEAEVLNGKWRVARFEAPAGTRFWHGADWSNGGKDPHTLIRSFVLDNILYIDYEVYANVDRKELPALWREVPSLQSGASWYIGADNARPDLIKFMRSNGFKIEGAAKSWKGATGEDDVKNAGVSYLRNYREIIIHERCVNTIKEAKNWQWEVDPKTEEILPKYKKGNDHLWDAMRYGHWKEIKMRDQTGATIYG